MKKLFLIILLLALIIYTAMIVNAHPGRTDSAGGHTDHSTGEYHYHHGYSAHDHYDMDGDGDVDCPYDFDDKTGINSGNNSSSNYYSSNSYSNDDNVIIKTETITKTVTEEVPYIPPWIYWVIGILVAICLIMLVNIRWKKEEIYGWEKQYRKIKDDYEKAIEEHERSISEVKKTCSHKIEQNTLFYENKTRSLMQSINSLQIENATLKENDRKSKIIDKYLDS